jgi:singapore isolate B (sub-type 7) whole genome shotgun sequence assembly, scaffold_18
MLHIAPEETLAMMVTLGYSDDPSLLYIVTKEKKDDWEKYQILRRNVVHAFLFGKSGVGKVTI